MQAITLLIKLEVPDGTVVTAGPVAQCRVDDPAPAAPDTPDTDPPEDLLDTLKRSFLAAVKIDKERAFAALGCARCNEVSIGDRRNVIDALKMIK